MSSVGWSEQPGSAPQDPAGWPPDVLRLVRRAGHTPAATGPDLVLSATAGDGEQLRYLADARRLSDETYRLRVDAGPPRRVEIVHGGRRGLRWALNEVLRAGPDSPPGGDDLRHPAFGVRGVIEGFYGEPWTHEQRLDMLTFLADHNLNTYCYAAKADPYLRRRWHQPYPEPELARLRDLVATAAQEGVAFWYCISPGLDIRYADPGDLDALMSKLDQVRELGVCQFGLLLDDIPGTLQHPGDRDTFPDLASAHAHLAGEVYRRLRQRDPAVTLAVCPTVYCGAGDEYYLARLGNAIDPRIELFWTGRAICSPTLDAADASAFARTALRPPLYWDNYPVNDVAMTNELHIGPYQGRDRRLYRFAAGVLANAMPQPESSKVALATIADYLWDPAGYQPEASWQRAIAEVAGERDAAAVRALADNLRTSCLSEGDAPELTAELDRFRFDRRYGDPAAACARLAGHADAMAATARRLTAGMDNQALRAELAPWLRAYATGARVLAAAVATVRDGAPPGRLAKLRAELAAEPARVFGDVLDMFLGELREEALGELREETDDPEVGR